MPLLPWDKWPGLKAKAVQDLGKKELSFLDELAELSMNHDANFTKIKEIYNRDDAIRVPADLSKVEPVWN
jgi:hypothetical protein